MAMFAYNQRVVKLFEILHVYKELGEDRQENLQMIVTRTSKLTQSSSQCTAKWIGR